MKLRCKYCSCTYSVAICIPCSDCKQAFCSLHKLPEQHACTELEKRKKKLQKELTSELLSNRTKDKRL